jgi:hypothetical protein
MSSVQHVMQRVSLLKSRPAHDLRAALLGLQGGYFAFTGLWPLVSIETFQWVTGRKTDHLVTGRESDHWLVMTVGVLVTAIGAALLTAAWRRSASPETAVLAVGSSLGLIGIDVIYVLRGVILPIYLVDAVIEAALFWGWCYVLWLRRDSKN